MWRIEPCREVFRWSCRVIYEQDFLPCSFGGRPKLGAHHALATLNEIIAGKKVSWVLEADLKNFFGSLDHGWFYIC